MTKETPFEEKRMTEKERNSRLIKQTVKHMKNNYLSSANETSDSEVLNLMIPSTGSNQTKRRLQSVQKRNFGSSVKSPYSHPKHQAKESKVELTEDDLALF